MIENTWKNPIAGIDTSRFLAAMIGIKKDPYYRSQFIDKFCLDHNLDRNDLIKDVRSVEWPVIIDKLRHKRLMYV